MRAHEVDVRRGVRRSMGFGGLQEAKQMSVIDYSHVGQYLIVIWLEINITRTVLDQHFRPLFRVRIVEMPVEHLKT